MKNNSLYWEQAEKISNKYLEDICELFKESNLSDDYEQAYFQSVLLILAYSIPKNIGDKFDHQECKNTFFELVRIVKAMFDGMKSLDAAES
jgi:hypothetical protein